MGFYIRSSRRKAGYWKAELFSDAIEEQTGRHVSADTLYKIESGRQEPSITQLMAIAYTLGYGEEELAHLLYVCSGDGLHV